ncbi:MAG: ATP-binding protein [Thermodesulfobacteriota bacterium]
MPGDATERKYYRSLVRNIILAIVIISFTPLILVGGVILDRMRQAYHQKAIEHLSSLSAKHSQDIDRFLADRMAGLRVLARSYSLDQLGDQGFLSEKLRLLKQEYDGGYVDLGLIGPDGIQTGYAGPYDLNLVDYSQAEWYKNSLKSDHFISDVFVGLRNSPHFIIAVKLNQEGRDWILRSTIDFQKFSSLVENIRLGMTGRAFILNFKGESQTNTEPIIIRLQGVVQDFLPEGIGEGTVRVVESQGWNGRPMILAASPLKGGQWFLCLVQELDEFFAPLNEARKMTLSVFLVGGLGIIGVTVFISRRMVRSIAKANREKAALKEKVIAVDRLASLGELAAGVAHEISNPVAIMIEEAGWIEDLIEDDLLETEEGLGELKRAVKQIKTQGDRCKELAAKLLRFARRSDPRTSEVNLNEVVGETLGLLRQKIRYATIRIETHLAPDLPAVAASPAEIQQVIINLLNNSLDALGVQGGRITLNTRSSGANVFLEVEDTGPGIPETILDKIFDPFFTTKPLGQGVGLGLSICFGIVNKLGGEINVSSKMGQGSLFTVRLPAWKKVTAGPAQAETVKTDPALEALRTTAADQEGRP